MRIDDAANDLEGEPFRRWIHRKDFPTFDVVLVATELNELARLQLSAVKEAHATGEQHDVAFLDAAIEEWLAGPRRLDHSAVVLQHRLKNPETFARRDDSFGDHLANDRSVHPRLERCNRRDRAGVLITMRNVIKKE